MPFNPSPKVSAARNYVKKFNRDIVVIISFKESSPRYEIVSYGKTRELCNKAEMIGTFLENAITDSGLEL
jgi:hypothetical protein